MVQDKEVHLRYCYQGEYANICKYNKVNCPAKEEVLEKVFKEKFTVDVKLSKEEIYRDEPYFCMVRTTETDGAITHGNKFDLTRPQAEMLHMELGKVLGK